MKEEIHTGLYQQFEINYPFLSFASLKDVNRASKRFLTNV